MIACYGGAMAMFDLLAPITAQGGSCTLPDAEDWMQGRTLYGLSLIHISEPTRLLSIVRQGRNVPQVRSEIWCEGQCTLTAFWLFGAAREPNAVHPAEKHADWPGGPEENETVLADKGPAFIRNNFELRRAQDQRGPGEPVVQRWARVTDRQGLDPVSELILLGDVLPPGAVRAMQRPGPLSSINWSFNLLDPEPRTQDGWWLSQNASQHADGGYSSERLRLWNTDGQQVLDGMQCAAIFG